MKQLQIAPDLALPLEAVTDTFGVLAARGAGKSNLAAVMAEQMFAAGLPFVVVDPVGSWYGLRAGADGTKGGGLPIPIFGGPHGDVPLEREGGEIIADLVASRRLSCVLDLTGFESEGAKKRFLLGFARRLYLKNTDPLHLFLEEADDFVPQRPMGADEAQLLRAWENIVRRGRARGLGMTAITQRSASINKNVLTQVQTLFVLRTTGPQDRKAIEEWVRYHDVDRSLLESLSGLPSGEGWVWSPLLLGQTTRHKFNRRATFDSGATPKNLRGKDARPAATLADVDLGAIAEQMAGTIERAKADDPRELRKQLAEKDKRIRDLEREVTDSKVKSEGRSGTKSEVPVLTDADRDMLSRFSADLKASGDLYTQAETEAYHSLIGQVRDLIEDGIRSAAANADQRTKAIVERLEKARFQGILERLDRVTVEPAGYRNGIIPTPNRTPAVARPAPQPNPNPRPIRQPSGESNGLKPMHRAMLTALAQHPNGLSKKQILIHTGYASSGPVSTAFADLARAGAVEASGYGLQITAAGAKLLGKYDPLPVGAALREWLFSSGKLSTMEAALLRVICTAYPQAIRKGDVLTATRYASSGPVSSAFAKLVNLNYVRSQGPSMLVASQELFS